MMLKFKTLLDNDTGSIRLVKEPVGVYNRKTPVASPTAVACMIEELFDASSLADEHVWLICCDIRMRCKSVVPISSGSESASFFPIREIARNSLMADAISITIVHNHPSGELLPSDSDLRSLEQLRTALYAVGIQLNDFLIVGGHRYYSAHEAGLI